MLWPYMHILRLICSSEYKKTWDPQHSSNHTGYRSLLPSLLRERISTQRLHDEVAEMNLIREKKRIKAAFRAVKTDMTDVDKRLSELEGDIYKNIRLNLKDLKDKLADGSITVREYDERYKRVMDPTMKY